jgi:catechol 2,3-dioxygenase-like lactoylglutathione lyase family enzyme
MQQQMSLITLGVRDLARSRRFYRSGFGWTPALDIPEVVFFHMNGFVLALWPDADLAADSRRPDQARPGSFALAHNVASRDDVVPVIEQLLRFGGRLLRAADAPSHGGYRGYVADPDDHAWEIAWNPAGTNAPDGRVTFGT